MVKKDVEIGGLYRMKVSNKITTVRIDRESRHGGWEATNVVTKRQVRVRTAGKLRGKVTSPEVKPTSKGATAKRYTGATRAALAARGMSTERGPKTTIPDNVKAAIDTAIMYLGDFIYNGAESGQRDEVNQLIGTLSEYIN